jgi:hypothetical protein
MGGFKKQHYVPQVYLRRFTAGGERLYVFDKLLQDPARRIRLSNVRDVAHENDFYDIVQEVLKPEVRLGHNRKMVENLLSRFDAELGSEVEHLAATAGEGPIDPNRRALLARALGIQAVRTRDIRDTIVELYQQSYEGLCRELTEKNWPGQGHLAPRVQIRPEFIPVYHASFMLESGIKTIGRAFFNHTWVVGVNRTQHPLYTSDQPVVRFAHLDHPRLSNEGFASPGIEVAFPLDSDHLLIMRDPRAPGGERANDGSAEDLDDGRVSFYNRLQVEQSRRQVYCRDDSFALASEMCAADPELTAPTGRKATVEMVPTDDPLRSLMVVNVRAMRKKK